MAAVCVGCGCPATATTPTGHPACEQCHTGSPDLDRALSVFQRWLWLPDPDQVIAVLGAAAGNLLDSDPFWLLLVGASGSGKTETVEPLDALGYVHKAATLSEAAMLSASSRKDRESGATGGLLRQVGDFGIILAKDFTSVLSMHREGRAQTLAALREIADGSWSRPVGTGGGRVLRWEGKAGFIGAVTPAIDRHSAVMGTLGERFVLYRIDVADPKAQARQRLANQGSEARMRSELADAVRAVLDRVPREPGPSLGDDAVDRLVDLAAFVVWARTPVDRDGYRQDVVAMPSREAPARLAGSLGCFLAGLEAIGADPATRWRIIEKTGWDCVPDLRRRMLGALHAHGEQVSAQLIGATGIPKTTADRTLEDLALLGLVTRTKAGDHQTAPWSYRLSAEARGAWPGFPSNVGRGAETFERPDPGSLSLPLLREEDFSGEATPASPRSSPSGEEMRPPAQCDGCGLADGRHAAACPLREPTPAEVAP